MISLYFLQLNNLKRNNNDEDDISGEICSLPLLVKTWEKLLNAFFPESLDWINLQIRACRRYDSSLVLLRVKAKGRVEEGGEVLVLEVLLALALRCQGTGESIRSMIFCCALTK
ncbi:hypothetical protein MKW98_010460, partial [Papaver atlanticum]